MTDNNGVKIKLIVDDTDVKSSAKELKQSFKDISNALADKEVSKKFASLYMQLEKSTLKADDLRARMKELENTTMQSDYSKLSEQLKKLDATYLDLLDKQYKYGEAGKRMPQSMVYKIQATKEKIDELKTSMAELAIKGENVKYILGSETDEYARLSRELGLVNNKTALQTQELQQLATQEGINIGQETQLEQETNNVSFSFSRLKETVGMVVKNGIAVASAKMSEMSSGPIPRLAKSVGKLIVKFAQLSHEMTKVTLNKIKDFFRGGSKGVDDMSKSFKRGLTKVFAYGFGIRSLFRLFNKLRGYAKDALQSMAKQFDDVNRDMSKIVSTFSRFKNSIGTMVQPIIHALLPALVTVLNVLSNAMTKVGEFFAVLTGQKYIYKATEANIDYAKSLDDATASTKKNTKEVKKNQQQLGYYDKLNVIGKDKDKDKTPSTSGLGGNGTDGASGFVKANPTKAVSEFAKKVKEAWKKGDFTEVGNIIGKKLQNALNNIPWKGIQKTAKKLGKSVGTLINGFVETETGGVNLGTTIGESIAEAINTAIIGFDEFLKNTHWDSVAMFIVNGLNGAIKKLKWKKLGGTLARAGNAITTMLSNFFLKTDWKKLGSNLIKGLGAFIKNFDFGKLAQTWVGLKTYWVKIIIGALKEINWTEAWKTAKQKLVEFFKGIPYKEVFGTFGEATGAILSAIISILIQVSKDIANYTKKILDLFKPVGNNIMLGILKGILTIVLNIGPWIYKNVIKSFVDGFKKGFKISSPSKVMMQIGVYIIQGLLNGIKDTWTKGIEFIKNIPTKIKNIFKGLPSFFRNIWSNIKSAFSNVGSFFSNAFSDAWKNIKSIFSLSIVKTFFSAVLDGIKSVFVGKSGKGGIIKTLKDAFSDAWKAIKDVFSKGGELFEGIKNGVADTFSSVVKSLLKGINSVIKVPFEKINDILEDLKDVKIPLPKPLKDIKPFTFVKTIPVPQIDIPGLAQGAVIPPNREFLAMLGDQKQGTNIETPLDTMIQAFNTALAQNNGATSHEDIVLRLDGRDIAKAVWDEDTKKYKQSGAFMPRYS